MDFMLTIMYFMLKTMYFELKNDGFLSRRVSRPSIMSASITSST